MIISSPFPTRYFSLICGPVISRGQRGWILRQTARRRTPPSAIMRGRRRGTTKYEPGRIRTFDTCLKRAVLYQTELRAHECYL